MIVAYWALVVLWWAAVILAALHTLTVTLELAGLDRRLFGTENGDRINYLRHNWKEIFGTYVLVFVLWVALSYGELHP